jgi:hypothetical protein
MRRIRFHCREDRSPSKRRRSRKAAARADRRAAREADHVAHSARPHCGRDATAKRMHYDEVAVCFGRAVRHIKRASVQGATLHPLPRLARPAQLSACAVAFERDRGGATPRSRARRPAKNRDRVEPDRAFVEAYS